MGRLAVVRWRTPPPTSVEEDLVLYDDGVAHLLVIRPRDGGASVGTWSSPLDTAARAELVGAAAGTLVLDLLGPFDGPGARHLALVDAIAADVRMHPRAVATFSARVLGAPGGASRGVTLAVAGIGTAATQLELDPDECSVHFTAGDREIAWQDLPDLEAGFVTADAAGLGGLRRRAVVEPGTVGALVFDVDVPGEATSVGVRVAGRLWDGLPDEPEPRRFLADTAPAPTASSS